nr:hypothetical protein [Tanacetum cinerariifolium]
MMVQAQEEMGAGSANLTDAHHTPIIIQLSTFQPQKKQKPRKTQRKDIELPQTSSPTTNIADEAVNEEMDDNLVMAATTASSLEAEQDSDFGKDASKQRRISDIDADEGITLVSTHDDKKMFDADQDLGGEEVFVAKQDKNVVEKEVDAAQVQVSTVAKTATISIDEVTLAQALQNPRPRLKGLEQRLARDKAQKEDEEANIALIESWDNVQAKINADYQLAERLQAEEQQELNDEEKATLFMQLLEKKRKFFASKRAEENRNKPPTQVQQRKIMCTYLKNVEGKKLINLKNKSLTLLRRCLTELSKREDVKTLWKLVKAKHRTTRPEDGYERVLWGDLKVMFEPHIEDEV